MTATVYDIDHVIKRLERLDGMVKALVRGRDNLDTSGEEHVLVIKKMRSEVGNAVRSVVKILKAAK